MQEILEKSSKPSALLLKILSADIYHSYVVELLSGNFRVVFEKNVFSNPGRHTQHSQNRSDEWLRYG
jgi:hypothetical protein